METRDYVQIIKRRAWIVVLVPILASAVAFAFSVGKPQQYRGTATVVVPTTGARAATPPAVAVFIANFRGVLTSPSVVQQVAKATKVPSSRVRNGLGASQPGSTGVITVTYTDSDRKPVAGVLQAATRAALALLDEPRVAAATQKVSIAQKELDEAQAAVDKFRAETGLILPNEEYRVAAGELSQLRIVLQQARVAQPPEASKITALEAAVGEAAKKVGAMGGQVASFKRIEDRLNLAGVSLDRAQGDLRDAQAQLQADGAGAGISVGSTLELPKGDYVRSRVQGAGGTALALTLGFVVLLEMLKSPRRPVRPGTYEDDVIAPASQTLPDAQAKEREPVRLI